MFNLMLHMNRSQVHIFGSWQSQNLKPGNWILDSVLLPLCDGTLPNNSNG